MDPVDNSTSVSRTRALAQAMVLTNGIKNPPRNLKGESAAIIARHRRRVAQEIDDVRRILTKAQDMAGSRPAMGFDEEDLAEYRKILEAREEVEPAEDAEDEIVGISRDQIEGESEDEKKSISDYSTSIECTDSTKGPKFASDPDPTQDGNHTKALSSTVDFALEDKHTLGSECY
ncbi:hypothetical protein ACJ41O_003405 [Fusarium nematophilum]